MKLSTFIVLILFVFTPLCSCAASFTLDAPPNISGASNVKKGVSSETPKIEKKKKDGFFSKIFKKKKPRPVFDSDSGGYRGNLPNVESEFEYKKTKNSTIAPPSNNAQDYTPEEFQKSKTDDPLFLDVILNKEKASQYTVDMMTVMRFLESFRTTIAEHRDVQQFNANVNMLDLYARKIEKLYKDKSEGMSPSYYALQDLSYKAKLLGNLKFDANYYSKFQPVTGTAYDPMYIKEEENKLLLDLDKTVFEIRQLDN